MEDNSDSTDVYLLFGSDEDCSDAELRSFIDDEDIFEANIASASQLLCVCPGFEIYNTVPMLPE